MSYASLIQKDLPLATWELNEVPSNGGSLACDKFLGSSYNGTYIASISSKAFPLVFGSQRAVIVAESGASFSIPSLDRLSIKTREESFSLEFVMKFVSSGFQSTSTLTKIVGKANSETGIYLQNSSIVGIVGDVAGDVCKVVVPVDNLRKPMHVVLSYSNKSISLSVNGETYTSFFNSHVITKAYASADEKFVFQSAGTNRAYAVDTISMYGRMLTVPEIKRHVAYAFGYEPSSLSLSAFGGFPYNLSAIQTPIKSKVEKGSGNSWSNCESIDNMYIDKGVLRIENAKAPRMLLATDKDESVFSYTVEGVSVAAGGYIEIDSPLSLSKSLLHGFGFVFNKTSQVPADVTETLIYLQNTSEPEKSIRFYLQRVSSADKLYVSINNESPVELLSVSTISGYFSAGYFYDPDNIKLTVFAGYNTTTGATGQKLYEYTSDSFYVDSIRIGSNPSYTNNDEYLGQDNRYTGKFYKVSHIKSLSDVNTSTFLTIHSSFSSLVNRYSAVVLNTEKRFVVSANGSYSFFVPLTQLAVNETIVGNHRIDWGTSSPEVTVKVTGKSSTTNWLNETTLTNNSAINDLVDEAVSATKYLEFQISIASTDVEVNPTKIFYFRLISYFTSSLYETTLVCDGPDIVIRSATTNAAVMPKITETPFLFDEEKGGLYVSRSATIVEPTAPISSSATGIGSLSFFINPSANCTVFAMGSVSVSLSSTTLSPTGCTLYVNGSASNTVTLNQWNHVTAVFSTPVAVSNNIVFGSTASNSNFYLDNILVCGKQLTATEVSNLNKIYKGNNPSTINPSGNKISVFDSEISSLNGESKILQPVSSETAIANDVDLVLDSGSLPTAYNSANDVVVDGKVIKVGSRILVLSGGQAGIHEVATMPIGGTVTYTEDSSDGTGSVVYVKRGSKYAGKYFLNNGSSWSNVKIINKVVSYEAPKSFIQVNVV